MTGEQGNGESTEVLTCGIATELMAMRIEEWKLLPRTDEESIYFAYHVARWIYDAYGISGVEYNVEEISGDVMPTALKPLLRQTWHDGDHFSDENRVRLRYKADYEYIDSYIPGWEEISKMPTFKAQLERIANDPVVLAGIKPYEFKTFDVLHIQFEPKFYYEWGLDFYISPHDVRVRPYGKSDKTQSPTDFLSSYHDKPKVLAETITELALLAARHSLHRNVPTDADLLEAFEGRLDGSIPIIVNSGDLRNLSARPGSAMKNLILRELVKMGKISQLPWQALE